MTSTDTYEKKKRKREGGRERADSTQPKPLSTGQATARLHHVLAYMGAHANTQALLLGKEGTRCVRG